MRKEEPPLSYWITLAQMGFEDDFCRILNQSGISHTDLAERLGVSLAIVSEVLDGTAGNHELATMAKLARAVGGILQISLIKEGEEVVRVVDYETAALLDSERTVC